MKQPNDKGVQFYEYVKDQGIKVPPTYEEFSGAIANEETGSQFYNFVKEQGIKVPETFGDFQSAIVKKKGSASGEDLSVGGSDVSPSESPSPSGGKTFLGFNVDEALKVYDTLPPKQKKLVDLKLRKIDNDQKVQRSLPVFAEASAVKEDQLPEMRVEDDRLVVEPIAPKITEEQKRLANEAIAEGAKLEQGIQSLEGAIAFEDISASKGVDPNMPEYFEARKRYSALEQEASSQGLGVIDYVQQNPQAREILDGYESTKVSAERSMIETYLDYVRQTEGDGAVDDLTKSVVRLMPQIRDRARQGELGYAGLFNYLEENLDNLTQAGMSARIDIDRKLSGELDYESAGSQTQLAEVHKLSELVVGANAFYANYANQKILELSDNIRTISDENTDAIETIDKSVAELDWVSMRIGELETNNPRVFGSRRKTASALQEQSKSLAKEMMEVEAMYKRLEQTPEDMALAEAYNTKAQEFNQKRDAFNNALEGYKQTGDGVIAEHDSLLSDYQRLFGEIENAKAKLGVEFFDAADEIESLSTNYELFAKDSMASTNLYGLHQKLSKTYQDMRMEDALNTNWGYFREAIVMPFIEPIYNTVEGVLVDVPNIIADLVQGDDRGYSGLRSVYENLQENRQLAAIQLPKIAATGFITRGDDDDIPWHMGWASATSQGMGSVATFFTGGGLGAKAVSKGFPNLAPKVATKYGSKVGITATGFAQMTNGLYQESLAAGLDTRDAAAISLSMGLILGYTETLVNDYTVYAPWEQAFRSQMFKSMAQNFGKKGWFKPSMATNAAMVGIGGTSEAGEEVVAEVAEGVMKGALNIAYGEDLYDIPDATEVAEAGIVGFVTGGITKSGGLVTSAIHPQYAATFLDVIDDAERFASVSESLSRTMTSEEFAKFQALANTYRGALEGYDVEAMDDVTKMTVADAVIKVAQMEEQIKRSATGDVLETQLRPKINKEKARIIAALAMQEADAPTAETPEGRLASEVVEEQQTEAFVAEVEEANREFDTYTTEVAGNEVLTTEVSNALGAIERNESLEDTQADRAISTIFSEIDRVENSNLSEANKERITSALYDIAEQIDNYDFRATYEISQAAEGEPTSGSRRVDADQRFARQRGRRYGGSTLDGATATDGNGNRVTVQVDDSGKVFAVTEDGTRSEFAIDGVQMTDARFDKNGRLIQGTFNDGFVGLKTEITLKGEAALDLAIKARSNQVGEIPAQRFNDAVQKEEVRLREYRKSEETTPTQPVVREQGDTAQESVTEETRSAPQERGVDGAEEAAAETVAEGDTATPRGVEGLIENIDKVYDRLDQFGKETLGVNLPVALAKAGLKAAKKALQAGQSLAEALNAAVERVKNSRWYQNRTAEQQAKAEQAIRDAITQGKPIPTRTSPIQMKSIRKAKDRVGKLLREKKVTLSVYERLGLNRLNKMSFGVINQMNGDVVQTFDEALNNLLDAYEASPTENIADQIEALMDGFADTYLETKAEANIKEGDSEAKKRQKYEEAAEAAALEIEEAMEQLPDFAEIVADYREALVASDPTMSKAEVDANINTMRNYIVDALATLRGKTASELFAAFEAMYGFDFAAFGADTSSSRIMHELRDAASILQTLVAREKIPSNLQALQTAAQIVIAHEKAPAVATEYGRQKDLLAWALERIGAAFSQEAAQTLPSTYAKVFFGRTSRGGIIMNALKYFTTYVNNVDRARSISNQKYSYQRTRLNNMLLEIKYQFSQRTPDNMSAKIARKFKKGAVDGAQLNSFTQDVFNVLSSFVMMQRMIDNNPEFYSGSRKKDLRNILDAWAKTKEADPRKDPYSTKGKRFAPISIQERLNDELYEGVYAWLNESGFIDSDGKLDWQRALEEMSSKERTFMAEITSLLNKMGAVVSTHSNAARNKDLPMFEFYLPIDEADETGGGATMLDPSVSADRLERELTTPEANEFGFTTQGSEDLGVNRPTVPSAAMERTNRSTNRPIILSTTALILPYLRQVYRDAYITPEAQKAQKGIAFMAAAQQNADAKTQNAVRSDLRKVAGMVTEVFTPRTMMDTPETKMLNRVGEKVMSQLTKLAMVTFLTRGILVKMIADTSSDYIINLFRNGFQQLNRGFYENNISEDAMRWEAFIDGSGFQLVDQLGSETSQLQAAGISTGYANIDKNRTYSKYSMRGQWLSALNSVAVPSGRRTLLGAVKNMLGIDAAARKGVGSAVAIMATANFANSPAALIASVRRSHKQITGREFDINEWVDQSGNMRDLTEAQSALLTQLVQKADRTVAERSGESSPSAAPLITRKSGINPWVGLAMHAFAPFMNWMYNNTMETYRASTQVITGRKFSDKENLLFGKDIGDGSIATRISGLNEVLARTMAAFIYVGARGYMIAMLEAAMLKSVYKHMFEELIAPDDEDEELWEEIKAVHGDEIDKMGEALPNMMQRAIIETYVEGVPIFNLIPWASVVGENNIAAVPYDKEDLERNRYLRVTQGVPFKDDFDEEEGGARAFKKFLDSIDPEEMGRKGGSAPIFQFLNSADYMASYYMMDAELKRVAEMEGIPTGERYFAVNAILGMILKNPLISDFNALERKNVREGRKRLKEFMKSANGKAIENNVNEAAKDFEGQELMGQ